MRMVGVRRWDTENKRSDETLGQAYFLAIGKKTQGEQTQNSKGNKNINSSSKLNFLAYFGKIVISFEKNLYSTCKKNSRKNFKTQGKNSKLRHLNGLQPGCVRTEVQRYKDTVRYVLLGMAVPGYFQEQLLKP